MDHAPGWNEHLATSSEHAVKVRGSHLNVLRTTLTGLFILGARPIYTLILPCNPAISLCLLEKRRSRLTPHQVVLLLKTFKHKLSNISRRSTRPRNASPQRPFMSATKFQARLALRSQLRRARPRKWVALMENGDRRW